MTVGESPKPPAAAYFEVAQILGPGYFKGPPPSAGVEATIVGTDGCATVWCLGPAEAAHLQQRVRNTRTLRWDGSRRYDERNRLAP